MNQTPPPWFLDWHGRAVAVVASGPSVKKDEVALLRNRIPVLAIKENYDLAPWAEVVYGCDAAWWRNRNGLKEYRGLKVSATLDLQIYFKDLHYVSLEKHDDIIRLNPLGTVGAGGNSGFQAVNLAVQFGATRILLLGFDMDHHARQPHWYGRNRGPGRTNPDYHNYDRWRRAFIRSTGVLEEAGVEVINGSAVSALACFRKRDVRGTLEEWGL